ncbi:MAG: hypothetical protein MHPSP_002287, partial [Paramarteilia canceri]
MTLLEFLENIHSLKSKKRANYTLGGAVRKFAEMTSDNQEQEKAVKMQKLRMAFVGQG